MILYYVRHGDPTYSPNALTPLGRRQAEAVAKRLAVHGIDKIFVSSSNRAVETAQPLAQITKLEPVILDWANEDYAFWDMSMKDDAGNLLWVYRHREGRKLLAQDDVRTLGRKWYTHPGFAQTKCAESMERIQKEVDAFLLQLGYRHDLEHNCFLTERPNEERVAFFAHEGMGLAILSCILDIPYPMVSTRFDMGLSAVTAIEFCEVDGILFPRMMTFSNDSHLYREGLPTLHQGRIFY